MNLVKEFLQGNFDHTPSGMDHYWYRQRVDIVCQSPHCAGSVWNRVGSLRPREPGRERTGSSQGRRL
jgi:hypothetical protein